MYNRLLYLVQLRGMQTFKGYQSQFIKGHMTIHFMDHLTLSVQDFRGSHNYKRAQEG